MIYFLISVIVVMGLGGWFIVSNLLTQIEGLESHIQKTAKEGRKSEDEFYKYYIYFLKMFNEAYSEMRRVDKRGAFSSDDEVGFAFKVIYRAIEDIAKKLEELEEEQKPNQTPEQP